MANRTEAFDLTAKELWPGLPMSWSQAHRYIQQLRREGWEVSLMPSGWHHRAYWCQKPEGGEIIYVTFWREHVACVETEDFEDTGPTAFPKTGDDLPDAITRTLRKLDSN